MLQSIKLSLYRIETPFRESTGAHTHTHTRTRTRTGTHTCRHGTNRASSPPPPPRAYARSAPIYTRIQLAIIRKMGPAFPHTRKFSLTRPRAGRFHKKRSGGRRKIPRSARVVSRPEPAVGRCFSLSRWRDGEGGESGGEGQFKDTSWEEEGGGEGGRRGGGETKCRAAAGSFKLAGTPL